MAYEKKTRSSYGVMIEKYGADYLMTSKEAAEYLGMNEGTLAVWRYREKHGLPGNPEVTPPFSKKGRSVRYRIGDLENFIKNDPL